MPPATSGTAKTQYLIGQNKLGWDGEWQYKQRVTPDGKYWETEMAIPRKTLYQADPLHDGDVWWIGLATDPMYNYPWSGWYDWKIPVTFKDETPQIRLAHPERCITNGKRLAFDLAITNTTGQPFTANVVARLEQTGCESGRAAARRCESCRWRSTPEKIST